jgi:hypothetical protein
VQNQERRFLTAAWTVFFHLIAAERCGDHEVARYLSNISAMKREFLRFAADG